MKLKFLLIIISSSFFCLNFTAKAQDLIDLAQTFSQREVAGSARMQGMGGSSASLGGDLSSIIINPAGLGFFNRSEFSFSPSINFHNSSSNYLGNSADDYKTNFNFGTLGVVLNSTRSNAKGAWKGGSFGISMTRTNDFQNKINYNGSNNESDFVDAALGGTSYDNSNNIAFDDIYADLAFQTYLTDEFYDPDNDEYFLDTYNDRSAPQGNPVPGFPVKQSEIITTKGATYITNFSYGANFNDKLYLGAGLAITSISYEINRKYTETPNNTDLNGLVLNENRSMDGSGFNLSLGAIYRPITSFTIGVGYSSPTYYTLDNTLNVDLTANFVDESFFQSFPYDNKDVPRQYEYRSPAHVNAGLSYFIGKRGFITADAEYIDYARNKYSNSDYDLSFENDNINQNYKSVINYKIGGELRFGIYRARAGYALFADPLSSNDNLDRSRQSFSIGGGIRLKDYYIDLGIVNTQYQSSYIPYYGGPVASIDNNFTKGIFTFGFNF